MKVDVQFNKIGLDDNTLRALHDYIETQTKGTKKTYRFEIGEDAKGVVSGLVALGILGVVAYTTTSIIRVIYGPGS